MLNFPKYFQMELKNFLLQNVRIVTPVYIEGNFWDLNSQNIFRKF